MATNEQQPLLATPEAPKISFAFRVLMLGIISLICFGNYFAYDEIEPLEPQLKSVRVR
jgi:hypothetical protein